MRRREYICENGDVIGLDLIIDKDAELIIPTNVEIYNSCHKITVKKLQVYGYEFDMRYTKNNCITLPTSHLTKEFWREYIREIESLILFLGDNTIETDNWF